MAGKSNYDAEKQSRRGNRCLDGWRSGGREVGREEAVAPSAAAAAVTRHSTRFSQSRAERRGAINLFISL